MIFLSIISFQSADGPSPSSMFKQLGSSQMNFRISTSTVRTYQFRQLLALHYQSVYDFLHNFAIFFLFFTHKLWMIVAANIIILRPCLHCSRSRNSASVFSVFTLKAKTHHELLLLTVSVETSHTRDNPYQPCSISKSLSKTSIFLHRFT